jgi:hypothetical protein
MNYFRPSQILGNFLMSFLVLFYAMVEEND